MTRRYWNINLEEMMEAGVHFGHGTRKWNPRLAPYISAKRKGIHITNLTRTAHFLSEACDLVFDAATRGKQFLIVGTKNEAVDSVASAAIKARCHYVNKKWLGGMSTNWSTTKTRLHKFRDLRAEQKTGRLNRLPKRDAAMLKRQLSHLQTYLGGIKYMTRLPDIVIINRCIPGDFFPMFFRRKSPLCLPFCKKPLFSKKVVLSPTGSIGSWSNPSMMHLILLQFFFDEKGIKWYSLFIGSLED